MPDMFLHGSNFWKFLSRVCLSELGSALSTLTPNIQQTAWTISTPPPPFFNTYFWPESRCLTLLLYKLILPIQCIYTCELVLTKSMLLKTQVLTNIYLDIVQTYAKPMGPLTGVLKQPQEGEGMHYSIYWHLSNSIQFNRYKYLHIITNITCNRELRFPFQLHPSLQQLTSSCLINRLAALSSKTYSTNW